MNQYIRQAQYKKGFANIVIIMAVMVLFGVGAYFALNRQATTPTPIPTSTSSSAPIACTQEAKQCSDGSYVSRTGKNCEFAKCPAMNSPLPTEPVLKECSGPSDTSCPANYECVQSCGPPVVRLGDPAPPFYCQQEGYIQNCPKCLAANTLIDTPLGAVPIQQLRPGIPVWTINASGQRVVGVVVVASRVPVPPNHHMVQLMLDDGRRLLVSPGHPTVDRRTAGDLIANDLYDDARVVSSKLVAYGDSATYDILPSGETGFYFANGILLDSTLH